MIYCIAYDLNSPGGDYTELTNAIKEYWTWWHHLDSTWFIKTEATAAEIRDNLGQYIDKNDELLIFWVWHSWAGKWFSEKGYDWLKNNFFS